MTQEQTEATAETEVQLPKVTPAKEKPKKAAKKATKAKKASTKDTKAKKATKAKKVSTRQLDEFGFVEGKKRSKVAAMYARNEGATTSEVKRKHGHPHLNMLTSLKARAKKDKTFGFVVDKERKENKAGRTVTVYKIVKRKKAA